MKLICPHVKFQTEPFVKCDWIPSSKTNFDPLTNEAEKVKLGQSHAVIIIALARCPCAILSNWNSGSLKVPGDVEKLKQLWASSTDDEGLKASLPYECMAKKKWFPEEIPKKVIGLSLQ